MNKEREIGAWRGIVTRGGEHWVVSW